MMKANIAAGIALTMCLVAAGCGSPQQPPAKSRSPFDIIPEGKVHTEMPWIADKRTGVVAPLDNLDTATIYGMVHGVQGLLILEQRFLMKDNSSEPVNGVTLLKFPNYLPMATTDAADANALYWHFGRDAKGTPTTEIDSKEFYDLAVDQLVPSQNSVEYIWGYASHQAGTPPTHLDADLDATTAGLVENLTISADCKLTTFATIPQTLAESRFKDYQVLGDRTRRVVQAWDVDGCKDMYQPTNAQGLAQSDKPTNTTYGAWVLSIEGWNKPKVEYITGVIFMYDHFTAAQFPLDKIFDPATKSINFSKIPLK